MLRCRCFHHYRVLRQDDLGHVFTLHQDLHHDEALALVQQYTARGHKQLYWFEAEEPRPDLSYTKEEMP